MAKSQEASLWLGVSFISGAIASSFLGALGSDLYSTAKDAAREPAIMWLIIGACLGAAGIVAILYYFKKKREGSANYVVLEPD